MSIRSYVIFLATLAFATFARADDWPQWLGPQRDGVWRETGIVNAFPADGLEIKWRTPVGWGYGGPAVADGKVFVMDYVKRSGDLINIPDGRSKLSGMERVLCLDAKSGELLWTHQYDRPYSISYAGGPRCTPTVADGKVYTLGAEGDLVCLDAQNGSVRWSKELTTEYQTETPVWGFAAHPLVDGDRIYCLAGGSGSVAVALDKNTGQEIWRALTAPEPGYCPPTMIEHAGARQLLIWHPQSINSLHPETGKVFWSLPLQPGYGMSIMAPRKLGDHLYASAIGNIAALMKLDHEKPAAEVVWRGKAKNAVFCSNSTPFLDDGVIYGCDVETGALVGARMEDGQRLWQTTKPTNGGRRDRHATAFLVKHEDRYFLFNEKGDLILARLSRKGYEELSRFHVLEPTNEAFGRKVVWTHPAYAQKCMFARNDEEVVCVDLAAHP